MNAPQQFASIDQDPHHIRLLLDLVVAVAVIYRNSRGHAAQMQKLDGKYIRERHVVTLLDPLVQEMESAIAAELKNNPLVKCFQGRLRKALKEIGAHSIEHVQTVRGAEAVYGKARFDALIGDALIVALVNQLCVPYGPRLFLECLCYEFLGLTSEPLAEDMRVLGEKMVQGETTLQRAG